MEALERGDKKAEEEASKAYARAEVWEWWKAFREKRPLRDLIELGARRSKVRGSRRKRKKIRRPTYCEGRRVAEAMLADIPDARRLNRDWESAIVSADLATTSPLGVFSPEQLPEYIKRAEESRVYFDAVERIEEEAKSLPSSDSGCAYPFQYRQRISPHRHWIHSDCLSASLQTL